MPEPVRTASQLREELEELMSDGMGRPMLSDDRKRDLLEGLEEDVASVFSLYVKVKTARALGIQRWFLAEIIGDWPTTDPD